MSNKQVSGSAVTTTDKKKLAEEAKLKLKQEQKKQSNLEKGKLFLSFLVLALGFILFYMLPPGAVPKYLLAFLPVVSVVLFVLLVLFWCETGKNLIRYIKSAVVELKKVVWPTKNETMKQTFFVLVFVFLLASFAWLCDSGLKWFIYKFILGMDS